MVETMKDNTKGQPRYIRLRDDDFEAIQALARKRGWEFSQYVRWLIERELSKRNKASTRTAEEVEAQLAE